MIQAPSDTLVLGTAGFQLLQQNQLATGRLAYSQIAYACRTDSLFSVTLVS